MCLLMASINKDINVDSRGVTSSLTSSKCKQNENQSLINNNIDQKPLSFKSENKMEKSFKKKQRRRHKWRRRWRPYSKFYLNEKEKIEDREAKRANWLNLRMLQFGQPLAPYNTTQFLMADHNVRDPEFEQIDQLLHNNDNNNEETNSEKKKFEENGKNDEDKKGKVSDGSLDKEEISNSSRHWGRSLSECTPNRKTSDDTSSDEFYSSPNDEQDFMQKQFFETYENIHAERINAMSKTELVKEYIILEDRVEELENKLKEMENRNQEKLFEVNDHTNQILEVNIDLIDNSPPSLSNFQKLKNELKLLIEENFKLRLENETLKSNVSQDVLKS